MYLSSDLGFRPGITVFHVRFAQIPRTSEVLTLKAFAVSLALSFETIILAAVSGDISALP